ncbi:MAG: aspartyl protease family protein, partial [Pyrinomonadaceae bacterium]
MPSKIERRVIVAFRDATRIVTFLVFLQLLLSILFAITVLGSDKRKEQAVRALRAGDFEQAESLYRELLNKEKNSKDAMLGLSLALLKQRKLQESFDLALYVKKIDPQSARAYALAGTALLAVGDFKAAGLELNQALTLKPEEAMAVAGVAMIDFYENRLESSIRGLRRAIDLDSREPDYIFSLAQAASRTEHYKEAADAYERFLTVAPRTDEDRRTRIRGLIDFLHFLSGQNTRLYVIGGARESVIPINAQSSRPIIKVRVNDSKEEYRFVIDTGSGMTVVSDKTAALLGLRPVARGGMARAVGGGGKFEIVYGFLHGLQIADTRVENVPVYIRRFFNTTESIDGYIGLSVLSKFLVSIDYKSSTISLSRNIDDLPSTPKNFIEQTSSVVEPLPVLEPDQIADKQANQSVGMDIP